MTASPRRVEVANALSHGLGLVLAIAATPLLIVNAVRRGGAGDIVGASLFGASMIVLYLASTWFHAARDGVLRDRLQRFDHAAIYLLIAGTYTPFTLGVLGGAWGWTLFGITWGAAAIGVATKVFGTIAHPRLSAALYLVMGWLVVIALRPLLRAVPPEGIAWLVSGGLASAYPSICPNGCVTATSSGICSCSPEVCATSSRCSATPPAPVRWEAEPSPVRCEADPTPAAPQ